ncbi:MAG: chloride channel protein [Gammaproteobacteria bacterium]|nr:MAG: chloride channel protein [Gammaproteobacteria bacterium]
MKRLLSTKVWRIHLVLWSGAILVGLAAILFAIASEHANGMFRQLVAISPYLPFLVAPLMLMLVAWLTRRFFPGSQGSGIPQSIAALELRDHGFRTALISLRQAVGKILLTVLGLLGGASIGREGPTVHVGAAIMFSLGNLVRFPFHYMDRGLILAGSAAGIAAAFNTPLAGIVFAIEEMSRSFEQRTSGTILTAVVVAGITAMAIQGPYTYFGTNQANLPLGATWLAVLMAGVVGGAFGGLFSRLLILGSRLMAPLHLKHPLVIAGLCGLGIASIGYFSGSTTYGTGYAEAKLLVTGEGQLDASYPILKFLATVISYLSGIPGGIFAPSLATGAGMGALIADWFGGAYGPAIVLLGMVGYFTGVVQAPITAFVIVMEMTGNNEMLLPLMLTALIAHGTSRLVCPDPIYRALATPFLRRGAPSTLAESLAEDHESDEINEKDSRKSDT